MSSETDLIERTYRAYFTVFQLGEPRAITPYYHIPSVFMSPGRAFALASVRDAEQFFERFIYALRSRGCSRSVLVNVKVKLIANDIALVNARGERYKRDGELLEHFSTLYTMRCEEGTWRIVTATTYEPERSLDLV